MPFQENTAKPIKPVRLVFIHHSCGQNWLADGNGGLGKALMDNNYAVSDTNYGWGQNGIGDHTDIGHWWLWFRGPDSPRYLTDLYHEHEQHSGYSRLNAAEGENEIIMFKSCYPNSNLGGDPEEAPDISQNPLRGNSSGNPALHSLGNAKGIYIDLLRYFETRPGKLFIAVTAPPVLDPTYARNARRFNNWLTGEWLKGYRLNNVAVFDFYNVLAHASGDENPDTLKYPSDGGNNHPNAEGNKKATAEFIPWLNGRYNAWRASASR